MADINIMFWNIQDLGFRHKYRGTNGVAFCNFIAETVRQAEVDIFFIQELRCRLPGSTSASTALPLLTQIYAQLNNLPAPMNNWCLEFIKGAIEGPTSCTPFNTFADLEWATTRYEGYAMFFNLNIAKFIMQKAAPLPNLPLPHLKGTWGGRAGTPNLALCEQSSCLHYAPPGAAAVGPLANDVVIPAAGGAVFSLPNHSWIPAAGITPAAGGAAMALPASVAAADPNGALPAGRQLTAALTLNPGDQLPVGTVIGAHAPAAGSPRNGLKLNIPATSSRILVPEGFTLTDQLRLPAANTTVLPQYSMGLCIIGRPQTHAGVPNIGVSYQPFPAPPAAPPPPPLPPPAPQWWDYLRFPNGGGGGIADCRRPAFCTIKLNPDCPTAAGGIADQLIPIHVYHAPAASGVRAYAGAAASAAHSMYQVYNWSGGGTAAPAGTNGGPSLPSNWLMPSRAIMGGDFNEPLATTAKPYTDFTNTLAAGGTHCVTATAAPGIRVLNGLGGAAALSTLPQNKTTINTKTWGHPPAKILALDRDLYRLGAIDNVFYGVFTVAQAPVHALGDYYDLLTRLQGAGVPGDLPTLRIHPMLHEYYNAQTGSVWPGVLPYGPFAAGVMADIEDRAAFFTPLLSSVGIAVPLAGTAGFYSTLPAAGTAGASAAGAANAARAAAEFVSLLVSDHLPILFRMDL